MIAFELLAGIVSLCILIAGFFLSRIKDAETRGKMMQRIDTLEKTLEEMRLRSRVMDDRVGVHENDLVKLTADIESQGAQLARIETKLDKLIEGKAYEGMR